MSEGIEDWRIGEVYAFIQLVAEELSEIAIQLGRPDVEGAIQEQALAIYALLESGAKFMQEYSSVNVPHCDIEFTICARQIIFGRVQSMREFASHLLSGMPQEDTGSTS